MPWITALALLGCAAYAGCAASDRAEPQGGTSAPGSSQPAGTAGTQPSAHPEAEAPAARPSSGAPAARDLGFCGGVAGARCAEGEYCEFPVGSCGAGDQSGTCQTVPEVCTMDFDPVCGCNGETYSNACAAAADGQSVRANAPCEQD